MDTNFIHKPTDLLKIFVSVAVGMVAFVIPKIIKTLGIRAQVVFYIIALFAFCVVLIFIIRLLYEWWPRTKKLSEVSEHKSELISPLTELSINDSGLFDNQLKWLTLFRQTKATFLDDHGERFLHEVQWKLRNISNEENEIRIVLAPFEDIEIESLWTCNKKPDKKLSCIFNFH